MRPTQPSPTRGYRSPSWRVLIALLLLASPAPASFGEWTPAETDSEPRFFIESIAVEGVRHASSGIVVAESRIEAGRRYAEHELREAAYRVNRLPFVLHAAFSLGKGSERGRYRLLITVEEVESFFFGADLVHGSFGGARAAGDDGLNTSLTAGMRAFAGQGVFFAAVGDGEDLQAGYTRYRLLGRPALLRVAFSREACCAVEVLEPGLDPAFGTWTAAGGSDRWSLTLGVPLAGNHTLRLDAARLETGSTVRRPAGAAPGSGQELSGVERRQVELAWVFDSTDDPAFPTRGDALTVGVGLARLEGAVAQDESRVAARSRRLGLSAFGTRHWPLSPRQATSLSLKVLLSRSRIDDLPAGGDPAAPRFASGDVDALEAELGVRYSLALARRAPGRRGGELRWETVASVLYVETSPVFHGPGQPLWGVSASTTLAWRNTWGIFRIGFAVLDFDRGL